MTDRETVKMPAARFWMMHRSIDRVAAEESIRALNVSASAQSAEGFKAMVENMQSQMGEVVTFKGGAPRAGTSSEGNGGHRRVERMDETLDRSGLAMLKMMSSQKLGDKVVS